jgi:hypothetical protein
MAPAVPSWKRALGATFRAVAPPWLLTVMTMVTSPLVKMKGVSRLMAAVRLMGFSTTVLLRAKGEAGALAPDAKDE